MDARSKSAPGSSTAVGLRRTHGCLTTGVLRWVVLVFAVGLCLPPYQGAMCGSTLCAT